MQAPATLAETLIAESRAMRSLVQAIEQTAVGSGGVLITGEPGTGRGLISRILHEAGARAGAHVEIACDTLGPADADAMIFGRIHSSNGHDGSSGTVNGRFECVWPGSALHRAAGGTLCLRRVEDLPERAQAKLARILRDGELRVGASGKARAHGIRTVAIAEGDTDEHVRAGRIRQDLYKRLSSATLAVPPLRERRDDILRLADFFSRQACEVAALPSKAFTPAAESLLRALPWCGNAGELRTLVNSVVLQSPASSIDLDTLLGQLKLDDAAPRTPAMGTHETLRASRARFEREYIAAVLAQHQGRIPDTARSLGIQRTNLYRKLRSLQLNRHGPARDGSRGGSSRGRRD